MGGGRSMSHSYLKAFPPANPKTTSTNKITKNGKPVSQKRSVSLTTGSCKCRFPRGNLHKSKGNSLNKFAYFYAPIAIVFTEGIGHIEKKEKGKVYEYRKNSSVSGC